MGPAPNRLSTGVRNDVKALIWERGAGHTLASGSSSCAVAVACYDKKLVDERVTVHMEGGDLTIESRPGQGTTVRLSVPG